MKKLLEVAFYSTAVAFLFGMIKKSPVLSEDAKLKIAQSLSRAVSGFTTDDCKACTFLGLVSDAYPYMPHGAECGLDPIVQAQRAAEAEKKQPAQAICSCAGCRKWREESAAN